MIGLRLTPKGLTRAPRARAQVLRHLILTALILLALLEGACARSRRAKQASGTTENIHEHHVPGSGVELITAPGRPALKLVRRKGDPTGALALAVFPPGGTAGVLQMASLVKTRLDQSMGPHHLESHGIGFVLVRDAATPDETRRWVKEVRKALLSPVNAQDVARVRSLPLLSAAFQRADSLSPFGLCMGELGAEGKEAMAEAVANLGSQSYLGFLEQLRIDTAVAARVGLSALGDSALVAAASAAHDEKWDEGEQLDDSWTGEEQSAVVASRGAREIRVALRVSNGDAALAGARALHDSEHPLYGRLHALDPRLTARDVRVTLRPAGACVGLTITFDTSSTPPLERVAAVSLLAQEELHATVMQSLSEDEQTWAILSPEGAREAAALAAWTAVSSPRTGGRPEHILEYRSAESPTITHQALSRSLAATRKDWQSRTLPIDFRDETGQAEIWALLASPCGTLPETADEAGLRALTVSTLARDFDGKQGVTLEPWVSSTGVGLIAHGPARSGESVAQHAERVARAVGGAFYGHALDGRTLAATRAEQLQRVGSDPGVELVTNILGASRPSLANPWGVDKSVSTFSVADAERTRADLTQEPLRLALLTNANLAQGDAARQALEQWLAPARAHVTQCPTPPIEPIPPGTWEIETIDEEVSPGAYIAVFAPATLPVGHATAFLLNRGGGYLDRAFSDPTLVAHAEASFLGGPKWGGIQIHIGADPAQLAPAVHQARAVLAALATRKIPDADVALVQAEFQRREASTARTPRGRLIRLFETNRPGAVPAVAPTAESLEQLHRRLAETQHRVVVVRRRK